MSQLSVKALVEIRSLTEDARRLSHGGQAERKEADVLLSRVAAIRQAGISTDEARQSYVNGLASEMGLPEVDYSAKAAEQRQAKQFFRRMLSGAPDSELRDMAAGSATLSYTDGPAGGFLVPTSFHQDVVLGMKQLTPLMDEGAVNMVRTPRGGPLQIPGWDLTGVTSYVIGENTSIAKADIPASTQGMLGAFTYRTSPIAASFEIEQDAFDSVMNILSKSFAVAFARGIGYDLQNGDGTAAPSGLASHAADSGVVTASPSSITSDELLSIFHGVDRFHRQSDKCAWVMSDKVWECIRKTAASLGGNVGTGSAWRFMLDETKDDELLGKKVLIDPNLDTGVLASQQIVFGDLDYFMVRVAGGLTIRRNLEWNPESGQALYTAMLRVDSRLIQVGNDKPVVYGRFSS